MIELNGKYANAYIFADIVDEETIGQVIKVINSPVSEGSRLAIMADCHAGAGCVIGTTLLIKDRVCPNLVGVDIGCGMLTVPLGKLNLTTEDFKKIDEICHEIPSGFAIHPKLPIELWEGIKDPDAFLRNLRSYHKLSHKDRLLNSMGTLGGGNHFIEIDVDDEGEYYLVIHTGSRNLGKQVCECYQDIAHTKSKTDEYNFLIEKLKAEGKDNIIETELMKLREKFASIPKDLAFLQGEHMINYINDIKYCQEFASLNRKMIAKQILMKLFNFNKISSWNGMDFNYAAPKNNLYYSGKGKITAFETIHNYIDLNRMILRKGAVSANLGEKLLIPINMRDGSLICIGKGNEEYNFSAPHGAGRIMSRSDAKAKIKLEDFTTAMKGIYSTTVNQSTLDESPFAYKPIESILDNIKDTVEVVKIIKPVYNFKASELTD